VLVVVDDFFGRSLVLHGEARTTPTDLQQFITEARSASASNARQAFAQGMYDRGGQSLTRDFRDFTRQTIRFGVFNAECHILVYKGRIGSRQAAYITLAKDRRSRAGPTVEGAGPRIANLRVGSRLSGLPSCHKRQWIQKVAVTLRLPPGAPSSSMSISVAWVPVAWVPDMLIAGTMRRPGRAWQNSSRPSAGVRRGSPSRPHFGGRSRRPGGALGSGAQGNEVNRSLKSVWFAAPPSMGLTLKISSTVRSVEPWS